MESKEKTISVASFKRTTRSLTTGFFSILLLWLVVTPASAETYRWKDKNGEVHFGSSVPAEYADLPYDVISKGGLVLRRVDPSAQSPEVQAAADKKEKETQKSIQSRQDQSDRLLLIKYQSDAGIQKALELELDQVGYDRMLITKSFNNTNTAIIDKVRLAADQQRAGIEVSEAQTLELKRLYRALDIDKAKLAVMGNREDKVRERFATELLRYQELVEKYNDTGNQAATKPTEPTESDAVEKDQG
jgi:hypothetical protein